MSSLFVRLSAILVAVFTLQPALGVLKVGDTAPKALPSRWAQGEAVNEFEGDKVYVVEFWATWCGPCIAVIPHVNEIYKKHKSKGLVVIGQNLGEDEKKVSAFVKKMGSKMTYRVGVDDAAGTMGKKWLTAAGQNGIPCAFVVNKAGKIAYIGHPSSMKESLLTKLLAERSTKAPETTGSSADTTTAPSAKAIELANLAVSQIKAGELDKAEASIADLNESLTENFRYIGGVLELDLLLARKDESSAMGLSRLLAEDFSENTLVLNAVASQLVARSDAGPKLQELAKTIATPLSQVEDDGRCVALATLARVAFLGGDTARAIEFQTKAAAAAAPSESAAAKAGLEAYQQGRLP